MLDLGNQLLGHVQGKAASLLVAIEDIAGMLLPGKTGGAIRANAGTAAKAERAEGGKPQVGSLLLQPALDVGKGFGSRSGLGRYAVSNSPNLAMRNLDGCPSAEPMGRAGVFDAGGG